MSSNIRPTSDNYHLADTCSSDEESVTAPPYSPLSLSSMEGEQISSHTVEDQEESRDYDDETIDDESSEMSCEV